MIAPANPPQQLNLSDKERESKNAEIILFISAFGIFNYV